MSGREPSGYSPAPVLDANPPVPYEETFDALYGLQVDEVTEERIVAHVPVSNAVKQPMGLGHGGLYASIAESTTSMATAMAVYGDGKFAVGLSNSTSFLRPITEGTVHAIGVRR